MCGKCKSSEKTVKKVDQSQNGVKVIVHRFYDENGEFEGTWVEADCQCFGTFSRAHSNSNCPVLKRIREMEARPAFSPEEAHQRRMDAKYFPF